MVRLPIIFMSAAFFRKKPSSHLNLNMFFPLSISIFLTNNVTWKEIIRWFELCYAVGTNQWLILAPFIEAKFSYIKVQVFPSRLYRVNVLILPFDVTVFMRDEVADRPEHLPHGGSAKTLHLDWVSDLIKWSTVVLFECLHKSLLKVPRRIYDRSDKHMCRRSKAPAYTPSL